jgi:hypothetical protein
MPIDPRHLELGSKDPWEARTQVSSFVRKPRSPSPGLLTTIGKTVDRMLTGGSTDKHALTTENMEEKAWEERRFRKSSRRERSESTYKPPRPKRASSRRDPSTAYASQSRDSRTETDRQSRHLDSRALSTSHTPSQTTGRESRRELQLYEPPSRPSPPASSRRRLQQSDASSRRSPPHTSGERAYNDDDYKQEGWRTMRETVRSRRTRIGNRVIDETLRQRHYSPRRD